jgi:hypothetical protein
MDIKAIIEAAKGSTKPREFPFRGQLLYVRRCNTFDRDAFFAGMQKDKDQSKNWVVAFGLAVSKDDNTPQYANPADGVEDLKGLLNDELAALENMVLEELAIETGNSAKKG